MAHDTEVSSLNHHRSPLFFAYALSAKLLLYLRQRCLDIHYRTLPQGYCLPNIDTGTAVICLPSRTSVRLRVGGVARGWEFPGSYYSLACCLYCVGGRRIVRDVGNTYKGRNKWLTLVYSVLLVIRV